MVLFDNEIKTIKDRNRNSRALGCHQVNADTHHPLYTEIRRIKGNRLIRGKSWMGQAEDIQQVCSLDDKGPGLE